MNEHYKLLYTADQVDTEITRIAGEIVRDHRDDNPLFVGLLRGAAPFASKLMFEITRQAPDMHPDLDYMMVSTYGSGHQAQEPRIITDLAPNTVVKERTVIIVDDVLDKGITAEFVHKHLTNMGACAVELAVLAQKRAERVYDITPDYCGFDANDEWLVGMGMDDAHAAHEGYRWLDQVWEIAQD